MHFNIADLNLFMHIADLQSLRRGAERAALSAAAASSRLKSLEDQIGTRLFYRDSRGLTLTATGSVLLRHARIILRQVDYAKSDLNDHLHGTAGHVRIFANTTAMTEVLPAVLAQFMKERPMVTVDIQERSTKEVVRAILDGAADVGITAGPVSAAGLQTVCFSTDRLVLVTPRDHPLSQRSEIAFAESLDFPHIGLQGSTLHAFLLKTVEDIDRKVHFRILMVGYDAMCRMIEAGAGVGLVPETTARRLTRNSDVHIVQLTDAWASRERRVLYRDFDALPRSVSAFVNLLTGKADGEAPKSRDSAREAIGDIQVSDDDGPVL